jgi:hypothetical protein
VVNTLIISRHELPPPEYLTIPQLHAW